MDLVVAPSTLGELLITSYANLAMAHAAVSSGASHYQRLHYMIRARLRMGLSDGTMQIGSLVDEERLKLALPHNCCYCGSAANLSVDHLVPTHKGGTESADNIVWACRRCNSSKGSSDFLEWSASKKQFPPLLLLRRYLKLAARYCTEQDLLETLIEDARHLPFEIRLLPRKFPPPAELVLWCMAQPAADEF